MKVIIGYPCTVSLFILISFTQNLPVQQNASCFQFLVSVEPLQQASVTLPERTITLKNIQALCQPIESNVPLNIVNMLCEHQMQVSKALSHASALSRIRTLITTFCSLLRHPLIELENCHIAQANLVPPILLITSSCCKLHKHRSLMPLFPEVTLDCLHYTIQKCLIIN